MDKTKKAITTIASIYSNLEKDYDTNILKETYENSSRRNTLKDAYELAVLFKIIYNLKIDKTKLNDTIKDFIQALPGIKNNHKRPTFGSLKEKMMENKTTINKILCKILDLIHNEPNNKTLKKLNELIGEMVKIISRPNIDKNVIINAIEIAFPHTNSFIEIITIVSLSKNI